MTTFATRGRCGRLADRLIANLRASAWREAFRNADTTLALGYDEWNGGHACSTMSKTILFTDSNVFLHYTFFDELDWKALVASDEVVLALCPAVIRELDKKKFLETSARTRDRARSVVRRLGELLRNDNPVELSKGLSVWMTLREPIDIDFAAIGLDKTVVDDVILACVLDAHGRADGVVALASADLGLRLKAKALRIETFELPDEWRLPEETDELRGQLKTTQAKLNALKAAAPKLQLTFGDGRRFIERPVQRRDALSKQQIEMRLASIRTKYPTESIPLADSYLTMAMGRASVEQLIAYNQSLVTFYGRYEAYLKSHADVFERVDRTSKVRFVIENSGSQTAEDVDVMLTAETSVGRWRQRKPPEPQPPEHPERPRSIFDAPSLLAQMPMVAFDHLGTRERENAVGPFVLDKDPLQVQFHVNRIKPGLPVVLPLLFF